MAGAEQVDGGRIARQGRGDQRCESSGLATTMDDWVEWVWRPLALGVKSAPCFEIRGLLSSTSIPRLKAYIFFRKSNYIKFD
jgi:hypothetical protein